MFWVGQDRTGDVRTDAGVADRQPALRPLDLQIGPVIWFFLAELRPALRVSVNFAVTVPDLDHPLAHWHDPGGADGGQTAKQPPGEIRREFSRFAGLRIGVI